MKKILILSGISWNSTKQRHHIIAEILSQNGYNVTFFENIKSSKFTLSKLFSFFLKKIKNKIINRSSNENLNNINLISSFNFPVYFFNDLLFKYTKNKLESKYDIIFCYVPSGFSFSIINNIEHDLLIYDCVRSFSDWESTATSVIKYEKKIIEKMNLMFVDSFYLKDKFSECSPIQLLPFVDESNIKPKIGKMGKIGKISYFGSFSEHLDIDLINYLLDSGLIINFFGKNEIGYKHHNFIEYGYISSESILMEKIKENSDAIIIPYKGNMDGVIPAKLIQSISTGLPVFCSSFYDSRYLDEYIYLYNDKKHLKQIIDNFVFNDLVSDKLECAINFSKENTIQKFEEKLLITINKNN